MRILVCRLGAIGDTIITSPLIRYLKQQGHEIYYLGSEVAQDILKENPNIDKFILHVRDSIPSTELGKYFESVRIAHECDKLVDLCESLEVSLALTPSQPAYNYPKYERKEMCNVNYYERTFDLAQASLGQGNPIQYAPYKLVSDLNPEMFFTEAEEKYILDDIRTPYMGKKKILWGLSGSSRQKTIPPQTMIEVIKAFPDCIHITVGDEACRILEWPWSHPSVKAQFPNVVCRSGKYTIRESILACKYVDLVIAPDTGLLHGSGCFDTPKIGIFTNTTNENIAKHFKNNYSLDAKPLGCAPCFRLIYNASVQCTHADDGITPICISEMCQPAERIIKRINEVFK